MKNKKYITVLTISLILISLVPIWSAKYFPSQNGPAYLMVIKVMKELNNPIYNYSDYYEFRPFVIPYILFNLMIFLFHLVFPLLTAEKICLSIYAILLPLSVFYFLGATNRENKFLGFISFLFIYNWFLFRGYFNFCLGIALFLFSFGYWLKHKNNLTVKDLVILNILILLVYLTHLYVFLLLFLSMVIYQFLEGKKNRKLFHLAKLYFPTFFLLVLYFQFTVTYSSWANTEMKYYIEGIPYNPIAITFYVLKRGIKWLYCFSPTEFIIASIVFLFPLYFVVRKIFKAKLIGFKSLLNLSVQNKILLVTIILLILHLALPWDAFGWNKVGLRIFPFVFTFLLACTEKISNVSLKKIFVGATIVAALANYSVMTIHIKKANAVLDEFNSGISQIQYNKTILSVLIDETEFGNYLRPLSWAINYYNIEKGGASAYSASIWNTLVPVWYKQHPVNKLLLVISQNDPKNASKLSKSIRDDIYDYILIWGTDKFISNYLKSDNFHQIHSQGKLSIYENQDSITEKKIYQKNDLLSLQINMSY